MSAEQWRLECLTQLLAELKDSDLPGDFFLGLLKVRTAYKRCYVQVCPGSVFCGTRPGCLRSQRLCAPGLRSLSSSPPAGADQLGGRGRDAG